MQVLYLAGVKIRINLSCCVSNIQLLCHVSFWSLTLWRSMSTDSSFLVCLVMSAHQQGNASMCADRIHLDSMPCSSACCRSSLFSPEPLPISEGCGSKQIHDPTVILPVSSGYLRPALITGTRKAHLLIRYDIFLYVMMISIYPVLLGHPMVCHTLSIEGECHWLTWLGGLGHHPHNALCCSVRIMQ